MDNSNHVNEAARKLIELVGSVAAAERFDRGEPADKIRKELGEAPLEEMCGALDRITDAARLGIIGWAARAKKYRSAN